MGGIIVERQGYKRIHCRPGQAQSQKKICFNWQSSGHCYRHHCSYLHPQLPHDDTTSQSHPPKKQCHRQLPIVNTNNNNPGRPTPRAFVWKNPNYNHHNKKTSYISSKPNPRNPNCDQPKVIPKSKPNPKPNTESPKPIDDQHDDALCNKAEPNPANPSCTGYSSRPSPNHEDTSSMYPSKETQDKEVCANWLAGKCNQSDSCKFLHSWFVGQPFVCLATLKGHEKMLEGGGSSRWRSSIPLSVENFSN